MFGIHWTTVTAERTKGAATTTPHARRKWTLRHDLFESSLVGKDRSMAEIVSTPRLTVVPK